MNMECLDAFNELTCITQTSAASRTDKSTSLAPENRKATSSKNDGAAGSLVGDVAVMSLLLARIPLVKDIQRLRSGSSVGEDTLAYVENLTEPSLAKDETIDTTVNVGTLATLAVEDDEVQLSSHHSDQTPDQVRTGIELLWAERRRAIRGSLPSYLLGNRGRIGRKNHAFPDRDG